MPDVPQQGPNTDATQPENIPTDKPAVDEVHREREPQPAIASKVNPTSPNNAESVYTDFSTHPLIGKSASPSAVPPMQATPVIENSRQQETSTSQTHRNRKSGNYDQDPLKVSVTKRETASETVPGPTDEQRKRLSGGTPKQDVAAELVGKDVRNSRTGEGRKSQTQQPPKTGDAHKANEAKHTSVKAGSKSSLASNNMIGTHYKVGKKIGEGSFGVIYEGLNMLNNAPIAIKFEPRKSDAPQLRDEYKTYRLLAGSVGIPNAYYYGQEGLHNVLCLDLLGPSLEDMFDLCHRKFSVKTTCMVAKQMITRVQTIHEKNLIYRDIKPDNFLIGRLSRYGSIMNSATNPHSSSMVYMVDFGMAKQYRDPKTKVHIPYREKKSLSGTARYMSVNTHLGREQSRRDDLEALGHVFFYFLRGSLPWQGLKAATNKQKYEKIGEKKQSTPIKELCEGFPEEFSIYQNYAKELKFDEEPDYEYLKGLMNKVLSKNNFIDDGIYDWMIELDNQRSKKEKQKAEMQRQQQQQEQSGSPNKKDISAVAINLSNGSKDALPNDAERKLSTKVLKANAEKRTSAEPVPQAAPPDQTASKTEKSKDAQQRPESPRIKEKKAAEDSKRDSKLASPRTPKKAKSIEKGTSWFAALCGCCRSTD